MVTRTLMRVTSLEAAALAATNASTSKMHATKNNDGNGNKTGGGKKNGGGKKRALPSLSGGKQVTKRQRATDKFNIDLSDVPPQQPILKRRGRTKVQQIDQLPRALSKGPPSKYTGVHFDKVTKKWLARITIEGKLCHIGLYENEEEAAIDYARAVLKYRRQGALGKAKERKSSGTGIDLSNVPPQQPIPKSKGHIKEGASKYTGVYFHKPTSKWKAAIRIEGKQQCIGYYKDEEEAAIDYARAVFKYKGKKPLDNARERTRKQSATAIDFLSDVPPQLPILKSDVSVEEGASKYAGVYYDKLLSMKCSEEGASKYVGVYYKKQNKKCNKWQAQIGINGVQYYIGCYENEEEAAIDYARAAFKYHGFALSQNAGKQPPTSRNG